MRIIRLPHYWKILFDWLIGCFAHFTLIHEDILEIFKMGTVTRLFELMFYRRCRQRWLLYFTPIAADGFGLRERESAKRLVL